MRKLSVALCLLAGCATQLLDGDWSASPPDLAGQDLTTTPSTFLGVFTWVGAESSSTTVCDNGNRSNDPPPAGDFAITAGPAAGQVNIGAGTSACPIFIFDVSGGVGTLTDLGVTCASGPGTLTTRSGSLTTADGGRTASLRLVMDMMAPDGGGGLVHCTLTVAGTAARK